MGMAFTVPKKITSWSYSRYALYNECPAHAKYKFIDKLPEPSHPAMQRGNDIHKLAEDFTKGLIPKLPSELKLFADQFKELKASKPIVEETLAFRTDWSQTTWDDWQGCAVRIKTDAICLDNNDLYIIDHKTGKYREGYEDQLSLYALGGMLAYPHVKQVHTQLWYVDGTSPVPGDPVEYIYEANQMPDLRKGWERKVKPMLNDTRFAPKPGNHCLFCPHSKAKGGPCKF